MSFVKTYFSDLSRDRNSGEPVVLAIRQTVLRWHEDILGAYVKRGNLYHNVNRKGASHRKARPKVEMYGIGAETFVVVMKVL